MNRREVIRHGVSALSEQRSILREACTGSAACYTKKTLAESYRDIVIDMLGTIRRTQSSKLLESAHVIARTVETGGVCWFSWDMGHSILADIFPGRPGVPKIFTPGFDERKAGSGDLLLMSIWDGLQAIITGVGFDGATEALPPMTHEGVERSNAFVIGAPAPWGLDAAGSEKVVYEGAKHRVRPHADIWIDTGITTLGAVVDVPGMGAPIGPASGILGMVTFWMMVADASRILSRDGKSLPVQGSGPILATDAPREKTTAPLMGRWFDTALNRMEMIGAEQGAIREAASRAVDSVLAGGKVWCYSRDKSMLAFEATTRRGGLALTRGVYDDKGTLSVFGAPFPGKAGDTVVMGIVEPDDPVDLRHLDTFRSLDMTIVSIGPSTRGGEHPGNRNVPDGSDIHLGIMCDADGLFALPGFERKICPVSGVLVNMLFWSLCLDIAEEIMNRTGDVPGVYLTGAVEGGMEHLYRVNALYELRGY